MAGLGRIQQRFNAAVITLLSLAGLRNMAGADSQEQAARGYGHPLHRKYLRTQNYEKATGREPDQRKYPGFCAGEGERQRRLRQIARGIIRLED